MLEGEPGRAEVHEEHAQLIDREGDEYEPVRQAQGRPVRQPQGRPDHGRDEHEPAQDQRELSLEERADLESARFEGSGEADTGSSESIVEEPVIEADESGRIISETVESHAYVPTPSSEMEPAPAEPQAAPAAKPKGRGKGTRAPRGRGGRSVAKAEQAPPPAESETDEVAEKPVKPRGRGSRGGKKRGARSPAAEAEAAREESAAPVSDSQPAATLTEPVRPTVAKISTDRHLIEDEPIAPEPPPRPRSFRDLDSIPDDYD
jgi:hypothetical protein